MDGKVTLAEHRSLVIVAGWLSALLALLCFDRGESPAALAWCADAEERGAEAGHAALAAWPAETQVLVALYEGRPHDAVTCARAGQAAAPAGSGVRVRLLGQEMRARAQAGERSEALAVMRRAERAVRRLPASQEPHNAFVQARAEVPPLAPTTFLLLGNYAEAERLTELAIGGTDPVRNPTALALKRLNLAHARAGLGRLDEATTDGMLALSSPRLVGPIIARGGELDATLQRDYPGTPQARDFHERYLTARRELEARAVQP